MKIIWALDPFGTELATITNTLNAIKALPIKGQLKIVPTTVVYPDYVTWPAELMSPFAEVIHNTVREKLDTLLSEVEHPDLELPVLLSEEGPSQRLAARRVADFAQTTHADLIVMNTHGRKNLSRAFLGSFAETTLGFSKVPVLTVNPKAHVSPIKKIMVPTDLSNSSHETFKEAIQLATHCKAQVTIFNRLTEYPLLMTPDLMTWGPYWQSASQTLKEQERLCSEKLQSWKKEAEAAGVKTTILTQASASALGEEIVSAAKSNEIDLIVLHSETKGMPAVLIGSIAREVIRDAHCPVLTIPKFKGSV